MSFFFNGQPTSNYHPLSFIVENVKQNEIQKQKNNLLFGTNNANTTQVKYVYDSSSYIGVSNSYSVNNNVCNRFGGLN